MTRLFFICWLFLVDMQPSVDKNYLLGKFNPSSDQRFSRLAAVHTSGSAVDGFLRREAYDAFIKMSDAAKRDGVHLTIISATRNFESQKTIWENKWNGKVIVEGINLTTIKDPDARAKLILRYSSMPGSSRHHWGTDMDLNSLQNSYFDSGEGHKAYEWLTVHASLFGFCQPYTAKSSGRTGYEEERWHRSYLPLSGPFLKQYLEEISYADYSGFAGSSAATSVGVIEKYVAGVACRDNQ